MVITQAQPAILPFPSGIDDMDYGSLFQDDGLILEDIGADPYSTTSPSDLSSGQRLTPLSNSDTLAGLDMFPTASPPQFASASSSHQSQQPPQQQQQQLQRQIPSQRHKLERKGHTKSRRGCYNCKRRRIKCQETHPACGHCVKTGLKCEYPTLPQITHQPHDQIPLFSLQDMRFFQHFLMRCYPHHPLGNENIWTHEVPCLSHTHEYLMHAILGMAACDLSNQDPSVLPFAMHHRMKAIRSIKKSLTEIPRRSVTHEEANAMIATCFALTFQSVTFEDGLAEYMAFIRGIIVVGIQMCAHGIKPIFANLKGDEANSVLEPLMSELPLIRREWVDPAVASIAALAPLCTDEVEVEYHSLLLEMGQLLYTSSFQAYKAIQKHYGWWIMLPHEKFQRIIDGNNQTMILLGAHWIALKQIMAKITEVEWDAREKKPPPRDSTDLGMIRWLRYLNGRVDVDHLVYNAWPMWVMEQLGKDLTFFGRNPKRQ